MNNENPVAGGIVCFVVVFHREVAHAKWGGGERGCTPFLHRLLRTRGWCAHSIIFSSHYIRVYLPTKADMPKDSYTKQTEGKRNTRGPGIVRYK